MNKYQELVKVKKYDNGLEIHKYHRKVFYNNRWNEDPNLVNARGTVYDADGNVVQYGFTKIFNFHENGTVINRDHMVRAVRKINGFFAAVSWYNGEILVSTTGSLDSDFVQMAKDNLPLDKMEQVLKNRHNTTFMFEICDARDPHIITEELGAYLIGARHKQLNSPLDDESYLDCLAVGWGVKRPEHKEIRFSDLVEETKTCKHEGWMVYDLESSTVLKMKSPYYLVSKFLARTKKMEEIFSSNYKQKFDEDFHGLIEFIHGNFTKEQFLETSEQDRLVIVQNFLDS
jgi:hypothetical protein